jgi:hypothetical protein
LLIAFGKEIFVRPSDNWSFTNPNNRKEIFLCDKFFTFSYSHYFFFPSSPLVFLWRGKNHFMLKFVSCLFLWHFHEPYDAENIRSPYRLLDVCENWCSTGKNKGKVIFNVLPWILIKNHLKQFASKTTAWTLNVILTPFVLAHSSFVHSSSCSSDFLLYFNFKHTQKI